MSTQERAILADLGDGLILRRAERSDAERLAEFDGRIHGEDAHDSVAVASWVRDLAQGPHPTFQAGDFTIVEDTRTGKIVSSLNTISQTWGYEGVSFGVGRPELVGTDAEYRNRGLVREQFKVVHEWSRQRGELIQVITGIPYYYRQFGYEMALELSGGRGGYEPQVPLLPEGEEEPYRIRPAVVADLPMLMKLHEQERRRSALSPVRDEALWRHELLEKSHDNVNRLEFRIIESHAGIPVGYFAHPWYAWGKMQAVIRYELEKGVSYQAVTPVVIRYLWKTGQENTQKREKTLNSFGLWFGSEHPAYQAMAGRLVIDRPPYAFYVRVPDLPAFLRCIAPALEKRLSASACAGYSGELKLSFYRDGVRIVFEDGRLATAESWKPAIQKDEGNAAFPNLSFLQLVFGFRSLREIQHAYPDCWASDDARTLLEALFPKKASSVWPVS